MHGQWQPYPNHPQVQELTGLLEELQEQAIMAVAAGNLRTAQRLTAEFQDARGRLDELTASLLMDESLAPRWVAHIEEDAASGAIPCLACGNNVPGGESHCSYCGWTYSARLAGD